MATAGVPPRVMGIGPVPATQKLLARLGKTHCGLRLDSVERGVRQPVARLPAATWAYPMMPSM